MGDSGCPAVKLVMVTENLTRVVLGVLDAILELAGMLDAATLAAMLIDELDIIGSLFLSSPPQAVNKKLASNAGINK